MEEQRKTLRAVDGIMSLSRRGIEWISRAFAATNTYSNVLLQSGAAKLDLGGAHDASSTGPSRRPELLNAADRPASDALSVCITVTASG